MSPRRMSSILSAAVFTAACLMLSADFGSPSGGSALVDQTDTGQSPSNASTSSGDSIKNPTFLADRAKWFDTLVAVSKSPADQFRFPTDELNKLSRQTANNRNLRSLVRTITTIVPDASAFHILGADHPKVNLQRLLLAQADAITGHRYKGEYTRHFSDNKGMNSACADFFAAIRQALTV